MSVAPFLKPLLPYLTSGLWLARWLLFVAFFRAFSAIMGYVKPDVLRKGVFSGKAKTEAQFNPLGGRLFAIWTAVTCAACVITAADVNNVTLLGLCAVTFALALFYFVCELFVFRSILFTRALSPFIIATISLSWLVYRLQTQFSVTPASVMEAAIRIFTPILGVDLKALVGAAAGAVGVKAEL